MAKRCSSNCCLGQGHCTWLFKEKNVDFGCVDMDDILRKRFDGLIKKNIRLFNLKLIGKKEKPFVIWEDYHLSTIVENELFSWELQMTIEVIESVIHMMMFMHPIIVEEDMRLSFIEFANTANLWLGSALGRFWVNSENDYCYECYLPEWFADNLRDLELQLFDKPFSHFKDCLTPLLQLKDGKWTVQESIKYLDELKELGYVNNSEYGL